MLPVGDHTHDTGFQGGEEHARALRKRDRIARPRRVIAGQVIAQFEVGVERDRRECRRCLRSGERRSVRDSLVALDPRAHGGGTKRRKRASASRCSCETRCGETRKCDPIARNDSSAK